MTGKKGALPYATATSGQSPIDDIRRTIQTFGCSNFAPMEDFDEGSITIQFQYRGRMIQLAASAKRYAAAYLKWRPYSDRMRKTKNEYEQAALEAGQIAVWSILRDWIKGQLMAIETGILSFDAAFLGQILLPSGKTVHEQIEEKNMLPALETPKGE